MTNTVDFLDAGNTDRDRRVFFFVLIFCAFLGAFYFFMDRGCDTYAENLKNCKPSFCTQRVKGFESKYSGQTSMIMSRKIIGLVKDDYFDLTTCNVIEVDDVDNSNPITCKYSEKTRNEAAARAAILFGIAPLEAPNDKVTDKNKIQSLRTAYLTRTSNQEKECGK